MMEVLATPDELALKQQVTAALAEQGVLAKIKAELRAAVFRVMHDRAMPPTSDKPGPTLNAFPAEVAATTMELVSECFAFFQWNHSLLVLRAEADLETSTDLPLRGNKLAEKLGLRGESNTPALLQLVQERLARHEGKQIPALQPQVEDFGVTSAALRFRSASLARQDEANEGKRKDLTEEESHSIEEEAISVDEEAADEDEDEHETPKGRDSEAPSVIRQEIDHKEGEVDGTRSSNTFTTGTFQVHDSDEDEEDNYVTQQTVVVSPASTKTEDNGADEENYGTKIAEVNEVAIKNEEDEGDEEVELEESVMEESIADDYASASDFESSVDPVNTTPSTLPPPHRDDEENEALPPPVPTRMMPPSHPLDSVALSTPGSDHEDDDLGTRDDDFDPEEEAARLSSLDAKLKAMEAEDDTGTLQQLKASLQLELQRETDGDADEGGDGDGYGSSDFEEEEEIASEVSEEVDSMAQESEEEEEDATKSKKPGGDEDKQEFAVPTELQDDRAVASEDVLNSYDYVEPVERPW